MGYEELQVTSTSTSAATPRASRVAGDCTASSRCRPPESKASAGVAGLSSASATPAANAPPSTAALVRLLFMVLLLARSPPSVWLVQPYLTRQRPAGRRQQCRPGLS